MRFRRLVRIPALLGFLCCIASQQALSQTDPEQRFTETLVVTERSVFVDVSVLPQLESLGRKATADFLVRIDGAPAELVNPASAEVGGNPVERDAPSSDDLPAVAHLVWLDFDLASQTSIAAAANELATAFESFPETELFSIVEASEQSLSVQENIARTALVLRLRQLESAAATSHEQPTMERRIAALNRLAAAIPRFRAGDLGGLWLISEPWSVDPAVLEEMLHSSSDEALSQSALGALQRTSRILASFGWVIFPVWARSASLAEEPRPTVSGYDRFMERGSSRRFGRTDALMWKLFRKRARQERKTPGSSTARLLEVATEVRLAPMAILARETSGSLAGDSFRASRLAERLRNRRRLIVRDSGDPGAGLRKLEVAWVGGDGRTLPAVPWVSSRTPSELGVARLLSAVEQALPLVGAPLRVHTSGRVDGTDAALCFAYPRRRGALRIMWWRTAEQKIEMSEPAQSSEPEASCIRLPGVLEGPDFVQLEALDSLEWGAGQLSALPR